jgi:SM-20-related protein
MELVPISQKVGALQEVWNLPFNKTPLANPYQEYPFLLLHNALEPSKCEAVIASLTKERFEARLRQKGLDESIRKTILHKPTPFIESIFQEVIRKHQEQIETFFNVSLFGGTKIQILEYENGGFYKCHADNASEIRKDGKLLDYKVVAPSRKITTLLFLNDDFLGGEIEFCHLRYFDGKEVVFKPKQGTMIVFPSHGLFAHEVRPVTGRRFAVVKWWEAI